MDLCGVIVCLHFVCFLLLLLWFKIFNFIQRFIRRNTIVTVMSESKSLDDNNKVRVNNSDWSNHVVTDNVNSLIDSLPSIGAVAPNVETLQDVGDVPNTDVSIVDFITSRVDPRQHTNNPIHQRYDNNEIRTTHKRPIIKILSETPRNVRQSMGPYTIHCPKHYIERRRVAIALIPSTNYNNNNNNQNVMMTEDTNTTTTTTTTPTTITSMERSQSLFLPQNSETLSDKDKNIIEMKIKAIKNNTTNMQDPKRFNSMDDHEDNNDDDDDIPIVSRTYVSRTLSQLEDATKNWFMLEKTRGLSKEQQQQQMDTIGLFTIQFNETTVSSLALWVAGGPKRKCIHNKTLYRPIVDTRFRNCGICNMYGHYEVECKHKSPELTLQFSNAIAGNDIQSSVTNVTDLRLKEYDITIEMCDGYTIEQRSKEEEEDITPTAPITNETNVIQSINDTTTTTIVEEVQVVSRDVAINNSIDIDGFTILEGETLESLSNSCTDDKDNTTHISTSKQVPVEKGNLVAWIVKDDSTDTTNPTGGATAVVVVVGIATEIETDKILVNVFRIIYDNNHIPFRYNERIPSVESLVWVPTNALFLVDEQNQLLLSTANNIVPIRKRRKLRKKIIEPIKARRTTKTKMKTKRRNKNYQNRTTNKPIQLDDGTYKRPRGVNPGGLVWDAKEGIWVLPPEI